MEPGILPDDVLGYILQILQHIAFGEAVLVAQDGVLVQIEWNEKLRLVDWGSRQDLPDWSQRQRQYLIQRIRQEFSHLRFGRLVIVVKAGRAVQIERTEKQRFTGLDGEGI
jgi:hypothetical protein